MKVLGRATVLACTLGVLAACVDQDPTAVATPEAELDAVVAVDFQAHQQHKDGPRLAGRTIQSIEALLEDGTTFTGRITNLHLERVGDEILASGRLIGQVNGQRINELFEGVALPVVDENGDPILDNGGVCPILYLELAPILLDVLGLVVELPETLIVEVRAERGPGNLLGNLLCALLGILD